MLREQETETQVIDVQIPTCSAVSTATSDKSQASMADKIADKIAERQERWRRRLGSDVDVVTVELVADDSEDRLGLSLEGRNAAPSGVRNWIEIDFRNGGRRGRSRAVPAPLHRFDQTPRTRCCIGAVEIGRRVASSLNLLASGKSKLTWLSAGERRLLARRISRHCTASSVQSGGRSHPIAHSRASDSSATSSQCVHAQTRCRSAISVFLLSGAVGWR